MKRKGLLSVYNTSQSANEEIEKAKKIKGHGVEVNILSNKEVLELQPSLRENTWEQFTTLAIPILLQTNL